MTTAKTKKPQYGRTMSVVYIFLDNLRIGGFQRLALDQAYALGDRGSQTLLYVLDDLPTNGVPNFLDAERHLLEQKNVSVISIGKSRRRQLLEMYKILKRNSSPTLLLSHSLRATFLLRLASLVSQKQLRVITTIHQLPTLSETRQRWQRFLYAQSTWRLLAYSTAVKDDWDARISRSLFFKLLIKPKDIEVLRNGIYLNRLPKNVSNSTETDKRRLVYLGRNTSWKGVGTFLEIAAHQALQDFEILFMIPDSNDLDLQNIPLATRRRIRIVSGKPISSYSPRRGDVHLYPASYGVEAKFVESVSLNCLELACLGVPSILTKNGLATWPDLASDSIFYETEWSNSSNVVSMILEVSKINYSENQIENIKSKVDIQNQISKLISL